MDENKETRKQIIKKCYAVIKSLQEKPENFIGVNAKPEEKTMYSNLYGMYLSTIQVLEGVEMGYARQELMNKK